MSSESLLKSEYIHRRAIPVDLHCDSLQRAIRGVDLGKRGEEGHLDIPRLREGGVKAQLFAICVSPRLLPYGRLRWALRFVDAFYRLVAENKGEMGMALSAQDIRRVVNEGRIAGILGIEGGHVLGEDLTVLRTFHRLGVRCLTLTWNSLPWATSSREHQEGDGGLSPFGREVVRELNCLGMVVDVSHASEATFWDVLDVSKHPVVASHSCARALRDHHRNLWDEQVTAMAQNGGLVGVAFCPAFLSAEGDASLSTVVNHIDHFVGLVGPDHVALGSDFDGIPATPEGLRDVSFYPSITEELLRRGYGEADIRKILGDNFLRVFGEVTR